MSFNVKNKLIFIDNFQFLTSSVDSSVKNLGQNDFQDLSQEFDSNVLVSFQQKRFIFMNK